jgi:catechol 2,3-dioxygenase-like lactoylglutathione lyase family enzyme
MREVYGGARIVTFVTKNLARSRAFWVDRLGFSVLKEEPDRFVMVNAGTIRLCIDRADHAHPAKGGGASLLFKVKNLAKTAKELDARGVGYETFTGARVGDYLETSDPDGYRIVFAERL